MPATRRLICTHDGFPVEEGMYMGESLPLIEVVDEIASTNAELKERGRAGAPHGSALRARTQTAGRGQRAHTWASPEGGLYLSVLIRPDVSATALPALPVACAMGAMGVLRDIGCPRVRLKWPNDIVVGGHKLAGVLTELAMSDEGAFAVCGIGVNIEVPEIPIFDGALAPLPATGLVDALAPGAPRPTLDELAEAVRRGILESVEGWSAADRWNRKYPSPDGASMQTSSAEVEHWIKDPVRGGAEGPLAPLLAPYNACLAFVGARVRVISIEGEERARGLFLGVDGYGHALVALDDGAVGTYDAVDVCIRPV